jgi:hypothetical protein
MLPLRPSAENSQEEKNFVAAQKARVADCDSFRNPLQFPQVMDGSPSFMRHDGMTIARHNVGAKRNTMKKETILTLFVNICR